MTTPKKTPQTKAPVRKSLFEKALGPTACKATIAKVEELTYRQVFLQRLVREGRFEEYQKRVKERIAAGEPRQTARAQACDEMGRMTPVKEKQIYYQYLREQSFIEKKQLEVEMGLRDNRGKKDVQYEMALAKLPAVADHKDEIEWIRSHPAMGTKDRLHGKGKNDEPVLITELDVLQRNGQAPSRAAVQMLQHWCNRPEKFFELMMSEQKKASTPTKGSRGMQGANAIEAADTGLVGLEDLANG